MGRPSKWSQRVTDNELLCLMVAQMLLGQPSDRFLAVARWRLGHLFPQLPSQSRYNERCRRWPRDKHRLREAPRN